MTLKAFEDRDLGYDRIVKELGDLGQPHVLVGIRQDKGEKVAEGDDLNLATIAAINEFGTEDIPSRPFLRTTVDVHSSTYVNDLGAAIAKQIDGKESLEDGLTKLGLKAVRDVQRTITNNDFQKNAPATIAAKGSTKPLIDTGRLRQSIDFEIGT